MADPTTIDSRSTKAGAAIPVTVMNQSLPGTGTSASNQVVGNVAHDGVDSGNPVKVGGKAYAPDSGPADVSSGDRADFFTDLKGRLLVYLATKLDSTNDSIKVGIAPGAANMANGQVAASVTAGTLVAARATRRSVTIKNMDATITVYIGIATVTAANGMELKAGQSISLDFTGLIQVIAASGTPTVAYTETYDS